MLTPEEQLAQLFEQCRGKVLSKVKDILGDQGLAEDVYQEVAMSLSRNPQATIGHPAPSALVMRSAINMAISVWRKRRKEFGIELQREKSIQPEKDLWVVWEALEVLPPLDGFLLTERFIEERSYEEIAILLREKFKLHVSDTWVFHHTRRAKQALRVELIRRGIEQPEDLET